MGWRTCSKVGDGARVGDALVGDGRVLHVPHEHRGVVLGEVLDTRGMHAGRREETLLRLVGLEVGPVAAANEHGVARTRLHALRRCRVGELPSVHRRAGLDARSAA